MSELVPGQHDRGKWADGVAFEIEFWDNVLKTKGGQWPADFQNRMDPDTYLHSFLCQFIDGLPQRDVAILDVGAGPLTVLGKQHPSKRLHIVATDALAEHYDVLLAKYGIVPLVRTVACDAEKLTDRFAENSFDLVHALNSIDHTYSALDAVKQMVRVVKPGCFVVMDHSENEGQNENYTGFHQWNFTADGEDFVIRGRTQSINVTTELRDVAEVKCSCIETTPRWVRVIIKKREAVAWPRRSWNFLGDTVRTLLGKRSVRSPVQRTLSEQRSV